MPDSSTSNFISRKKGGKRKKSRNNITGITELRENKHLIGPFSMDCEMVGVGESSISALARVTIIDKTFRALYDVHVKPLEPVTDFRTMYSGIRESDMETALPFEVVQNHVKQIITNKIVIGHSLHHDFKVLNLQHPAHLIRDINKCEFIKIKAGYPHKASISLKNMSKILLNDEIQTDEHCSFEDAKAALSLYNLVENEWEQKFIDKKLKKPDSSANKPEIDSLITNVNNTNSILNETEDESQTCKRLKLTDPVIDYNTNNLSSFFDDKYWSHVQNEYLSV